MSRNKTEKTKLEFLRQKWLASSAEPGCHDFILVLDHLKPDFNIGKIYRTAETFGAREIHVVGTAWFDPGPAVGSFKKVPTRFFADFAACREELRRNGYAAFALAPGEGSRLDEAEIPAKAAFILGNEGIGLSFEAAGMEGIAPLRIPQWGRSQSLNVSVAASIAAWEWLRRHGRKDLETRPQPNELRGADNNNTGP